MWKFFNNNPTGRAVGDCAVRAVSVALGVDWEKAFSMIAANGFLMGDMPTSNSVTGATLRQEGFKRVSIPNECPDCYTVKKFSENNPKGIFVLGTGTHLVTSVDGTYFDAWDSGQEIPVYVWYKDVKPIFNV